MFRALLCAVGFLTRVPIPHVALREEDVARSAGFFAWVGAGLGGLLWLAERALPFSARLDALLLVVLWALVTGALHLDGLADTVDGLSGGRGDRDRALAIMRDSRIGAHGAVALVLALALKWATLEQLLAQSRQGYWLAPAVARFSCTVLLAGFPYARAQGLGSAFAKRVGVREIALGALALAPLLAWADLRAWPAALVGIGGALGVAAGVRARLGGLTGDVHGAAIETCEIGVLLSLCGLGLR